MSHSRDVTHDPSAHGDAGTSPWRTPPRGGYIEPMLDQPQVPVSQRTNPERSFKEEVRALRLGEMSFYGKIVAVADAYASLTSRRQAGGEPLDPAQVLAELGPGVAIVIAPAIDPMLVGAFFILALVLAPMAGVTNIPFRAQCRRFGPGLVYVSEMVMARAIIGGGARTMRMLHFAEGVQDRAAIGGHLLFIAGARAIHAGLAHHLGGQPGP